jgi:hypothetical protein
LKEVYAWFDTKPYVKALRVPYHDVLNQPREISQKLTEFLEIPLILEAMVRQVDASLYRNRAGS